MDDFSYIKENKRLWLYISSQIQLWVELHGYLKHRPRIHEVIPGTSYVHAEHHQPETVGNLPDSTPLTIITPLSSRLYTEMILPGVIDKAWLMIYGYDETNDILYWWSTEMINVFTGA